MNKRVMYVFFALIIGWVIFWGKSIRIQAADNLKEDGEKIIYIVYDNSSSTYKWGGEKRTYWAEINYGVQAFYTMTNADDKVKIYFMATDGSYRNNPDNSILEFAGYNGNNQGNMEKIQGIGLKKEGSITYLDNVLYAIEKLNAENGSAEKWIVIFTDGQLENENGKECSNEVSAQAINKELEQFSNINACYIPICLEAVNKELDENLIFQPQGTEGVAEQLLAVCNHIYGRRSVQSVNELGYDAAVLQNGQLKISFDIPISKCILYAYCDGEIEGKLEGGNILWQERIKTPDILHWTNGNTAEESEYTYNKKTGFVAELSTDSAQNSSQYVIEFPNNSSDVKYEIYYEPAFSVTPQILQSQGHTVAGKYLAGECEVSLAFSNEETGEILPETAHFLSVEQFILSVTSNGRKQELSQSADKNRWQGSIEPGEVVITASTIGISGETAGEFYKDYASAQLVATLDEVYYMDQLEKKRQYIRVQAILDGENITEEIQEMVDKDDTCAFSCYLERNGVKCKSICFQREYDPIAECWKLYPVFQDKIDYSVSGNYILHVSQEINTDYFENVVTIGMEQKEIFSVGLSEEEIIVHMDNPWICKIGGLLFPAADKINISFVWNGQELPAEVLGDITVSGTEATQSDIIYYISGREKNVLRLKSQKRGGFFLQSDITDQLTVEGNAVLFGINCKIYDDSFAIEIQAYSKTQKIICIIIWLLLLTVVGYAILMFVRYLYDLKKGKRFWLGTKVYRSYPKGKNRIRGKISGKRKRDMIKERYTEYTLSCYLPREFHHKEERFEIKVRRHSKNRIEVLQLQKPAGCKAILLGKQQYTRRNPWMNPSEKIQLKSEKSIIEIQLENF